MFQPSPGRKPVRDACDRNFQRSEDLGKIIGGSFTLNVGAQGENDFRDRLILDPREQGTDPELLWANVIQGRESSSQNMVASFEKACSLNRENVGGLLDEAHLPAGAVFVLADLTTLLRGKESAKGAGTEVFSRGAEGFRQLERPCVFRRSQPESNTFRGARSDSGKAPQLTGEVGERLRIINRLHLPERRRNTGVRRSTYDDVKSAIWSFVTTSSSPRRLRSTRWM